MAGATCIPALDHKTNHWSSYFHVTPNDHKYLIHDRDSIFARHLDDSIRALGLAVLRSPFSSPKAIRSILREWVAHYNGGRPRSALGPGVPGPPAGSARASKPESRRLWTPGALARAKSVLGGLHHEYSLSGTPAFP
jgi:putative transposase